MLEMAAKQGENRKNGANENLLHRITQNMLYYPKIVSAEASAMKTLIELYDPQPFQNVLSTETFRPERTVFLCPPEVAGSGQRKRCLQEYLTHRGVRSELLFRPVSLLDAAAITAALKEVIRAYPDCALDIGGGSDAALFAAGTVCVHSPIPVFTYSRRKNTYFNIQNAAFAENLPCGLRLSIEDCFRMAGAATMNGRVDNNVLRQYAALIPDMFNLYLRFRREWTGIVSYIQCISQPGKSQAPSLNVSGAYVQKGARGRKISAPEKALREMQRIGLLNGLVIRPGETVTFAFRDLQVRAWLRDVGSILELYTYQCCLDTALFQDVRTSVVVDWDGDTQARKVTNEIDVMAARGVIPLFISCKTCAVKTEALNELSILRDRFGSEMARAAIVTAERANSAVRSRAQELNIRVIDLEDLRKDRLQARLSGIAAN